ncbi:hypothetical protein O181_018055 [Austropuccinia psidii MF-1]|uniref:Integrase catalytic domain-containing protein n=1 Tax=Austropuccinia psidii MF-1 TaxID=1389203 RepID=A0A9Q3C7Y7_9BASI|nr:hypothetical protein [Austropuccinia psidii MF-1]
MGKKQDRKLKKLVLDKGGEFQNNNFKNLAETDSFIHIFAPTEAPEHNGFAARANHTILEKSCCMLNSNNLSDCYWAEAITTGTYLSNILLTPSRNNHSPYSIWSKASPKIQNH